MSDRDNIRRLLEMSRKKAQESEEREKIQNLADAIGDRRERDVVDLLAIYEQSEGWGSALDYLIKAFGRDYRSPVSTWGETVKLESLKYREVVFRVLSCNGLEAADIDTITLLKELDEEQSLAAASKRFTDRVSNIVRSQIEQEDVLFFDIMGSSTSLFQNIINDLEKVQEEQLLSLGLGSKKDGSINIRPLWYTEMGRLALSELGVRGTYLNKTEFDAVISVLQVSQNIRTKLRNSVSERTSPIVSPSNEDYNTLIESIISQDVDGLQKLGSKYSIPTINFLTKEAIDHYLSEESSGRYRRIMKCLDSHLAIRTLDSVNTLESLSLTGKPRLALPTAIALGNFYHESAAAALIEIICKTKDKKLLQTSEDSLISLYARLPEVFELVMKYTETSICEKPGRLKRILRRMKQTGSIYYK